MEKVANRRGHAAQTQGDIFCVALELFRTAGYELTTIQDICEKANVSVGAFYYYYKSKEDVLNDSYRQIDHALNEKYAHVRFDDPVRGIADILCSMAGCMQEQGFRIPAQICKNQITAADRFILDPNREYCMLVRRLVAQGCACGLFSPDYPEQMIVDTILRVVRGILYDWCLHEGTYDLVRQVQADTQIILRHFEQAGMMSGARPEAYP